MTLLAIQYAVYTIYTPAFMFAIDELPFRHQTIERSSSRSTRIGVSTSYVHVMGHKTILLVDFTDYFFPVEVSSLPPSDTCCRHLSFPSSELI